MSEDFPLVLVQVTLVNRAAPPNGIGVRAIEGELVLSKDGEALYRATYDWYRQANSSINSNQEGKPDRIVFDSVSQLAPFDLSGGTTWSREILLIPRDTWSRLSWEIFVQRISERCPAKENCTIEFHLSARLDNGSMLREKCIFNVGTHFAAHIQGLQRNYFSTPVCRGTF